MARFTPAQLSDRWGGSPNEETLAVWRAKRKGPAFHKIGRTIFYDEPDIERFERECRRDPAKLKRSRDRERAATSPQEATA